MTERKKTGRKAYAPTEKEARQVRTLSGMGTRCADIAKVLGISESTLRKYYAEDLEIGCIQANAKVAESLFKQATNEEKPNIVAAIFWLKTRAGWKEQEAEGKKEERQKAAEGAATGVFMPSAPPLRLVAGGKK